MIPPSPEVIRAELRALYPVSWAEYDQLLAAAQSGRARLHAEIRRLASQAEYAKREVETLALTADEREVA